MAAAFTAKLEADGLPLLDSMVGMPLDSVQDRVDLTKEMLSRLSPGITHFIIHPAKDTPELRAIAPDWRCRAADYAVFMNEEIRRYLRAIGVQTIGYRALKDLM
jgi:chitin disaccharide deacetylase